MSTRELDDQWSQLVVQLKEDHADHYNHLQPGRRSDQTARTLPTLWSTQATLEENKLQYYCDNICRAYNRIWNQSRLALQLLRGQSSEIRTVDRSDLAFLSRYIRRRSLDSDLTYPLYSRTIAIEEDIELYTSHARNDQWQLDVASSRGLRFNDSIPRDVILPEDDLMSSRLEYSLMASPSHDRTFCPSAQRVRVRVQSLTPSYRINRVQILFRETWREHKSLDIKVDTEPCQVSTRSLNLWDLDIDCDLSRHASDRSQPYGTCVIYNAAKPPNGTAYEWTPRTRLAQDPEIRANTWTKNIDERPTPSDIGRYRLWRTAAAGYYVPPPDPSRRTRGSKTSHLSFVCEHSSCIDHKDLYSVKPKLSNTVLQPFVVNLEAPGTMCVCLPVRV